MADKTSRLTPKHDNFERDLPPAAQAAQQDGKADTDGNLNHIDENYLELSRSFNPLRGAFTFLVCVGSPMLLYFGVFALSMVELFPKHERFSYDPSSYGPYYVTEFDGWSLFGLCLGVLMIFFAFVGAYYLLRADMMPRDLPVRFNRRQRRVYLAQFHWAMTPFGRWGPEFKVWDWANVHAEIARLAAFTGQTYQVRYGLILAHCKPGTHEVIDRVTLAGPLMTDLEFEWIWRYICRYMEQGKEAVPGEPLRERGVYFLRSLFSYIEFIAPTRWGQLARSRMSRGEWVGMAVFSPILLIYLPVALVIGIGHYIAMSFARETRWPAEMDAQSRAA